MPAAKFHCAGCRTERSFKDVSEYSRNMLQGRGEDGAPRDVLMCRFCMPSGIVSVEKDFSKLPEHVQEFVSKWDYWDRKVGDIKMPPTRPVTKDKVLTVREAATYAGVDTKTIHNWATKGYITKVDIGGTTYVKVSTLDAYLDKRTAPKNQQPAPSPEKPQPGEPKNLKELGHAIYLRRKVEKKRQLDIAYELGVTQFDISKVELGRHTSAEKLNIVLDWMGYSEPTRAKLLRQKGLKVPNKSTVSKNGSNGHAKVDKVVEQPVRVFRTVTKPAEFDEATQSALQLLASATGQSIEDIVALAVKNFIQTNIADALAPLGIKVQT